MKRIAFVTGATSGIGEAICRKFIEAGFRVIATGRKQERLDQMAMEFKTDILTICYDVRDIAAT